MKIANYRNIAIKDSREKNRTHFGLLGDLCVVAFADDGWLPAGCPAGYPGRVSLEPHILPGCAGLPTRPGTRLVCRWLWNVSPVERGIWGWERRKK